MNIHFTSKELFEQLIKATLVKVEVGSYLYGTKNENSDTDYLCIYVPSNEEINSFSFSHHQMQFKDLDNNIDYIFTSLPNFIRNILTGDSTINFEVLHSKHLVGTCLEFLYIYRNFFYNYTIIRAYLGFARRDLKHVNKAVGDYEKNKRLAHAVRGLKFAYSIVHKSFSLSFDNKNFKNIFSDKIRKEYINSYSEKIDDYRKVINEMLNTEELTKFMHPIDQKYLDAELFSLYSSSEYITKRFISFQGLMELIYEANEKGVTY